MQGPSYLRIGDAERDQMTAALHEHFAQGRLTAEELDERLSAALTAKTVGDLSAIDRDLPQPHTAVPEPRARFGAPPLAGRQDLAWRHRRRPFGLLFVAVLLTVVAAASHTWELFALARAFFFIWLAVTVFGVLRARRWRNHPHH